MYNKVKFMADIPENAIDDQIHIRIFGGVWVGLEERHSDGSWMVQYVSGKPEWNARLSQLFWKKMGIAAGMFGVGPETEVDEVRVNRLQ